MKQIMSQKFRHFIPAVKRVQDFPFSFDVEDITGTDITPHHTITFDTSKKDADLLTELSLGLQAVFNFYKYLDKESSNYLRTNPNQDIEYIIEVGVVQQVQDPTTKKVSKQCVNTLLVRCYNFASTYSYTLIQSLEHLTTVLSNATVLTFDVETSGLDPEFDTISGINFATEKDVDAGYYIPLNHEPPYHTFNLSSEAIDIFYNAMVKAEKVYFFNARFDIRNLEFLDYTFNEKTQNIDNIKYDMSKVNIVDTQLTTYFSDPEWKNHDMDWAEKHFLGFYRLGLKDILKLYNIGSFNTTKLDPRNLLFYAGQDAITTMRLGVATEQYATEFKLSGQIDTEIIYPLMKMENRLIRIDTNYVEQELAKLDKRLAEITELITASLGQNINLNSSVQKQKLFESFGLDTGERTPKGAMTTSRDAVDKMISRLDKAGQEYPEFLKYLGEQSKLQILRSTFFYSLQQQMYHRNGRVRLNYRHGNTATGRFSSGKELD